MDLETAISVYFLLIGMKGMVTYEKEDMLNANYSVDIRAIVIWESINKRDA